MASAALNTPQTGPVEWMTSRYAHVGGGTKPRSVHDYTDTWNRLRPIEHTEGNLRAAVEGFCERHNITFLALAALGTRAKNDHDKGPLLAYAGLNWQGQVTAIKYRPINGTSPDSWMEPGSWWVRPIIAGKSDLLNWAMAEGESDGARLYDLVGDRCAIMVLPLGAQTFQREWADVIPMGATVALCHDADEDGDAGAAKVADILPGRVKRVRPPVEGGDWCDWDGDTEAFLSLAEPVAQYHFATCEEFASYEFPPVASLLGEAGKVLIAEGSLTMVWGPAGSGKTTFTLDGAVHLAAGVTWLGLAIPAPVKVCIIENEGPPGLFQQKLAAKLDAWPGPDPRPNLYVYSAPWSEFTFRDAAARSTLHEYCEEHDIQLVICNPTLGLGVGKMGTPDDTQEFVEWLIECGLYHGRAFLLGHHENKAGQVSGDWERHTDTNVILQRDGNRHRTKLWWKKHRWADLESDEERVMLEWVTTLWSYTVTKLSAATLSDQEEIDRLNEWITPHPMRSTTEVLAHVDGRDKRQREILTKYFDWVPGPRGAKLWLPLVPDPGPTPAGVADPGPTSRADGPGWEASPDE